MKTNKKRFLVQVILVLTIMAGVLLANNEVPRKMVHELNLTPDQQKLFQAHFVAQQTALKTKHNEIKKLQDALDQALMQDKPDTTKVNQLISQIKITQEALLNQRLQGIVTLRQILTTEQFKKMIALRRQNKNGPQQKFNTLKSRELPRE